MSFANPQKPLLPTMCIVDGGDARGGRGSMR
jgi:hypothetical protein